MQFFTDRSCSHFIPILLFAKKKWKYRLSSSRALLQNTTHFGNEWFLFLHFARHQNASGRVFLCGTENGRFPAKNASSVYLDHTQLENSHRAHTGMVEILTQRNVGSGSGVGFVRSGTWFIGHLVAWIWSVGPTTSAQTVERTEAPNTLPLEVPVDECESVVAGNPDQFLTKDSLVIAIVSAI